MTDLRLSEQQDAVVMAAQAMTAEMADAYEMLGMIKMSDFHRKLTTCQHIKVLAEFKEAKKYKGLEMLDISGNRRQVSTCDEFCSA